VVHDRLADDGPEARHALSQPWRHVPAMQRQVCATGSLRHQGDFLLNSFSTF
jgi:hypothetical protein